MTTTDFRLDDNGIPVYIPYPSHIARLLHESGWRIIGVSDTGGAIVSAAGLNPHSLDLAKKQHGSVTGARHDQCCQQLSQDELLALDCELLVPAATKNVLHAGNAANVKARVVLELANGPTSSGADRVFADKGMVVIPDVLANAGGVTVSYFEWVQNRQGYYWPLEEVHERLRERTEREAMNVWRLAETEQLSLRAAAYTLGLRRLAAAIEAQGTKQDFCVG